MKRQYDEDLFESTKMSFGEHLEELRGSLWKAVAAVAIGFLVGLYFSGDLVAYIQTPLKASLRSYYLEKSAAEHLVYLEAEEQEGALNPEEAAAATKQLAEQGIVAEHYLTDPEELARRLNAVAPGTVDLDKVRRRPLNELVEGLVPFTLYRNIEDDPRVRVIGFKVEDGFSIYVKAALVMVALLASPVVFYFVWSFIGAGLYPHERQYVHVFLPFSVLLFVAGAAIAFFAVLHFVLNFLFKFYGMMGIDPDPRINDWISFVMLLPVGFGIAFQLPLVMLFLERIGVFTRATYVAYWRIAVLVIFILSMFLTPADPYSLVLMATPLTALYFLGIALCRFMPKRRSPFGEELD